MLKSDEWLLGRHLPESQTGEELSQGRELHAGLRHREVPCPWAAAGRRFSPEDLLNRAAIEAIAQPKGLLTRFSPMGLVWHRRPGRSPQGSRSTLQVSS